MIFQAVKFKKDKNSPMNKAILAYAGSLKQQNPNIKAIARELALPYCVKLVGSEKEANEIMDDIAIKIGFSTAIQLLTK